jgi:hypothetical protein
MLFLRLYLLALKITKRFFIVILAMFMIFILNGTVEHFVVQNRIQEFKSRAVGEPVADAIIANTYYYRVPAREGEDTSRNIFDFNRRIIGAKGDIITSNRNPLRDFQPWGDFMKPFAKYLYLGHTSINSTEDGSRVYETLGNRNWENNIVQESSNTWLIAEEYDTDDYSSPVIIGLRIKNTTPEQRDKMIEYAASKDGYPYNYTFLFNRVNSFYCTDIVSRSVAAAGININYDHLATTGNDIICSQNVYIIFLREVVIENGVERYNIYYLDDGD